MQHSTSSLLKGILAGGACAAIALCGMLPASANPHHRTTSRSSSAPARASAPAHYAAPVRRYSAPAPVHYAAPVRRYSAPAVRRYSAPAPVRHYSAPVRTRHYAAPVRHYSAPARVERPAPVRMQHFAAPVRTRHYAAPVRHYSAPARVERPAPVRAQHFAAPVRRERAAPAPFVQRVAPERSVRSVRRTTTAPFVQYVRTAPRVRRETVTRAVATSPLVRAVYASRTRTIPVVYHPRYVAGRVTAIRRNEIVVDPPTGSPIVVSDVVVGSTAPAMPVGTYVTLPVTYVNGMYQYVPQGYASPQYGYTTQYAYAPQYGYAPQYDYAYAPPMYCSGDSSTALYAALLPAVVGVLTGNSSSFNSNDLASIALAAAAGGNNCAAYAPAAYYGQPAYSAPASYGYSAPAAYSVPVPVTYAVTQAAPYYAPSAYGTPYGNCLAGDEDGDEGCAPASGYSYNSYSTYGAYTPQQVQGVVVGRSGDLLMVLGPSGTPTFVYAAPALQSGFTVNGPIQPGQIVDAYGYYSGSTFIATALV